MLARSPLRYLAPVALIAFFLALIIVISMSGGDSGSGTAGTSATTTAPAKRSRKAPKAPPKQYTIQTNDTLGLIATRTGISEERLLALNPDLDPNALQVGATVKLRP